MQVFDHVEGERAALVGLLVEEVQCIDVFAVRGDVVGEAGDDRLRLAFRLCAVAGEGDGVEVDVVDQLFAFAAGGFYLFAQLGPVEGRAGGGQALCAGGRQFRFGERVVAARDVFRAGGGERGVDDAVRVQCVDQRAAQFADRHATGCLFDACLRLVVELLGEPHQTVGQRQHGVVVALADGDALQQILQRHARLLFQRAAVGFQ